MSSQMSEAEAIKKLNDILSENTKETATGDSGACVYNAGSKTYCASLSKSDCDKLGGAWTKGGKCP